MKNLVITILVVIVLGLGGYLVLDKFINEGEIPVNNNQNNVQENINNDYKIYSDNLIKKINSFYSVDSSTETRETWKYLYVNDFIPETYLTFELKTNGDVYAELDSRTINSEYERNLLSKHGESYKLSSKIIDIYLVPEGNGGNDVSLYMIKEDGSLKKLYYSYFSNNTSYVIEDNYKNLKNIISINNHPNMGSSINFATDINGNFYDLQ